MSRSEGEELMHEEESVESASESSSEEQPGKPRRYLIGKLPAIQTLAGSTFVLSLARLVDDPKFSVLGDSFDLVMNKIIPIVVLLLAMFMVVCMINGASKGNNVVPEGFLRKVVVLTIVYTITGVVSYFVDAFIPFASGSFFGMGLCYFLAFILFSANPERNPMLARGPKAEGQVPTPMSFYLFLVPAGFSLSNVLLYCLLCKWAGLSRLTTAKITASISFVVIQLVGHKNYPGFLKQEYFCYLTGSLGLYVFAFTGINLWFEEAVVAQSQVFNATLPVV